MQNFNISRFFNFFFSEWKMNMKPIGLLWGALALFSTIFCVINNEETCGIELDAWMFWAVIFFFLMAQGFYISISLGALSTKIRRTALLLQPVSKAEFMAAKMVSCFLLFPLLYFAFVVLVAAIISWYNVAYFDSTLIVGRTLGTSEVFGKVFNTIAIVWPCATAIYWTGAFYFGRFAVVKSALTALLLYIGLIGFSYLLFGLLTGYWDAMHLPLFSYGDGNIGYWQTDYVWPGFTNAFLYFGCVGMVVMSLFKFNEKTL